MKKTIIIRNKSTARYNGEKVRLLEVIGDTAYIFIPSIQEEGSVKFNKLKNIRPKPKVIKHKNE